jgi:hypothetical protein
VSIPPPDDIIDTSTQHDRLEDEPRTGVPRLHDGVKWPGEPGTGLRIDVGGYDIIRGGARVRIIKIAFKVV